MTVERNPDKIELIKEYLSTHPDVIFAVIFGSFAEGRQTKVSDIDIGVYTNRELELLELGQLVADIENIVKHKVDIVILNDLHKRSPAFAIKSYEHVDRSSYVMKLNSWHSKPKLC